MERGGCITDLFEPNSLTETNKGYKTICPDCGLQGGRTEGFIFIPETNSAYCHSSHKWFTMLQTAGLKLGCIKCLEGNDKGDIPTIDCDVRDSIYDLIEEQWRWENWAASLQNCGSRRRR